MKARSIQYLLSADQKLRKLSLKRLSTRVTTTRTSPRSNRSKKAQRPTRFVVSSAVGTASILAVIVVIGATALPAARQAFFQADPAADIAVAAPAVTAPSAAAAPAPEPEKKKVKANALAAAVDLKPGPEPTAPVKASSEAATHSRPEVANVPTKDANASAKELAAKRLAASSVASAAGKSESVTVSGCLEASDAGFRLKDTSGPDAMKARSWKSVFIKKHSPTIEMVAASNALQFPAYVGQRVSATGSLENRTMRADSLYSLSPSCR